MEHPETSDARRAIPAVDRLLADPGVAKLIALYGRDQVRVQARREVEALRAWLAGEPPAPPPPAADIEAALATLPQRIEQGLVAALGPPLARVLNATGIFLHTNLGRAPLPRSVARALPDLLTAYCDLELALATLAPGREVVVSRGELVEIGGSFRIPEILAASGARLVEVGATNRTRLADYRAALRPETALLLKVFPSNFRLTGFVAAVAPAELAALGREAGVPVLVDEGSGLLTPHSAPQLADHPSLSQLIAAGCDLACGSGDKLLGGPQAGLLVGRRDLLERCRRHPLYRALRPDRAGLAALEGVLRLHLAGAPLPLDRLWEDRATQRRRLEQVRDEVTDLGTGIAIEIVPAEAFLGGGSAPEAPIPGEALALPGDPELLARLRLGAPPIVGYLREGRLFLDLRTVDPEDDPTLVAALRAALA